MMKHPMNIKGILVGALSLAALPFAAPAATISLDSQLGIVGEVNRETSTFTPTGFVDFAEEFGFALIAEGDFSPIVTVKEASGVPPLAPTRFQLFDINFDTPGLIYEGGGFSFTATSFMDFDNDSPGRGFGARGILSAAGFEDTPALFSLSTQATSTEAVVTFSSSTTPVPLPAAAWLLLGGLGSLGLLTRKRRTA